MIAQIFQSSALLLIVALGGLVAERSGVLNIGLEGMITIGAFTAVAARVYGASPGIAILLAAIAGILPALLFAQFSLRWEANPFIVGLAINLLAAGAVPFMSEAIFGTRGSIRLPAGGGVPIWHVSIAAFAIMGLVWLGLERTVPGLRLRVAGEQPEWLRANAVGVKRYRLLGLVVSGVLSATAGAFLALRIGAYLPNVSSGRGWIALVIIYLGYRTPPGLAAAALFFGLMEAASVRAQVIVAVPPTVVLALPYVLTVIAFVSYAALRRYRT